MKHALVFALLMFTALAAHAEDDFNGNLRASPVAFIVGPNLRLDIRLTDNLSIGALGSYIDNRIKTVHMIEPMGGVILQYNFNATMASSWFVEGSLAYTDVRATAATSTGALEHARLYNITSQVLGGYQWFWGNINVAVGGGWQNNSQGDRYIMDSSGTTVTRIPIRSNLFVPEASIGWAFN